LDDEAGFSADGKSPNHESMDPSPGNTEDAARFLHTFFNLQIHRPATKSGRLFTRSRSLERREVEHLAAELR
jgi:hypothetical protein